MGAVEVEFARVARVLVVVVVVVEVVAGGVVVVAEVVGMGEVVVEAVASVAEGVATVAGLGIEKFSGLEVVRCLVGKGVAESLVVGPRNFAELGSLVAAAAGE